MNTYLTTAEEKVMQTLWLLGEAVVREILEAGEPPRPAYTTVATILNILEKKGFVGHKQVGNTYVYHPLISKEDYRGKVLKGLVKNYFSDSFSSLLSHFSKPGELSTAEMEELIEHLQNQVDQRKDGNND